MSNVLEKISNSVLNTKNIKIIIISNHFFKDSSLSISFLSTLNHRHQPFYDFFL